ncbi:hypothetical protein MIR68_009386 [Amoeboaphelidium protococcarum]|nr:hypothetical protein MIR68_009386 [Amoeboaphelidium protococcarum]
MQSKLPFLSSGNDPRYGGFGVYRSDAVEYEMMVDDMIRLGTYRLKGEDAHRVVYDALILGYRCIDTAAVYRNEEQVGQAIRKWIQDDPEQNRYDDLFITTKLAPKDHGELAYDALQSSIQRLGVPYVKCLMIHWPAVKGLKHDDARNSEMRAQSYAAIERLYTEGLCRCISLSNYEIRHIEEVLRTCTIKPHLLQFELHPLYVQTELVQFCRQHQIHVQAYSSFGEGKLVNGEINLKSLSEIAVAHKSPRIVTENEQTLGPLPKGWEKHQTADGKSYFVDFANKSTTWADPRTKKTRKTDMAQVLHGEIPYGWEAATSPQCGVYYIDHLTQTVYYDPPWDNRVQKHNAALRDYLSKEQKRLDNWNKALLAQQGLSPSQNIMSSSPVNASSSPMLSTSIGHTGPSSRQHQGESSPLRQAMVAATSDQSLSQDAEDSQASAQPESKQPAVVAAQDEVKQTSEPVVSNDQPVSETAKSDVTKDTAPVKQSQQTEDIKAADSKTQATPVENTKPSSDQHHAEVQQVQIGKDFLQKNEDIAVKVASDKNGVVVESKAVGQDTTQNVNQEQSKEQNVSDQKPSVTNTAQNDFSVTDSVPNNVEEVDSSPAVQSQQQDEVTKENAKSDAMPVIASTVQQENENNLPPKSVPADSSAQVDVKQPEVQVPESVLNDLSRDLSILMAKKRLLNSSQDTASPVEKSFKLNESPEWIKSQVGKFAGADNNTEKVKMEIQATEIDSNVISKEAITINIVQHQKSN